MCPTLCNPMDCSLPGSSVHGISQARILSGFPFPSPGDLTDPGVELTSLVSHALAGGFFTTAPPEKHPEIWYIYLSPFSKGLSQFSMLCHSIPEFSWDRYQTTYPNKVVGYLHHDACMLSCFSPVWLFVTLWTIACQASLSTEFFRQEYRSGLPCLPPGDLPDAGSNLSLMSPVGSLPLAPPMNQQHSWEAS